MIGRIVDLKKSYSPDLSYWIFGGQCFLLWISWYNWRILFAIPGSLPPLLRFFHASSRLSSTHEGIVHSFEGGREGDRTPDQLRRGGIHLVFKMSGYAMFKELIAHCISEPSDTSLSSRCLQRILFPFDIVRRKFARPQGPSFFLRGSIYIFPTGEARPEQCRSLWEKVVLGATTMPRRTSLSFSEPLST